MRRSADASAVTFYQPSDQRRGHHRVLLKDDMDRLFGFVPETGLWHRTTRLEDYLFATEPDNYRTIRAVTAHTVVEDALMAVPAVAEGSVLRRFRVRVACSVSDSGPRGTPRSAGNGRCHPTGNQETRSIDQRGRGPRSEEGVGGTVWVSVVQLLMQDVKGGWRDITRYAAEPGAPMSQILAALPSTCHSRDNVTFLAVRFWSDPVNGSAYMRITA